MSMFQKATRKKAKARIALIGPSGSGKTYTALTIAKHLGDRVAVIDTERGSASKYAGYVSDFDVCELESHAPAQYIKALTDAAGAGYDVVVVDSLSHAWAGRDGALEQVDKAAKRSQSGNSYTAWRDITPQHNALVDALLGFPGHLIVTMRAKTAYELQENAKGKKVPVKIGLAPVQRDGVEYEFDIVGDMSLDRNTLIISKTRCPQLVDGVFEKPGQDVADTIRAWLSDGADVPKPGAGIIDWEGLDGCGGCDSLTKWVNDNGHALKSLPDGERRQTVPLLTQAAARCGMATEEVLGLVKAAQPPKPAEASEEAAE
jgi:hypothetical protein